MTRIARLITTILGLAATGGANANANANENTTANPARQWIAEQSAHQAEWTDHGPLSLDSGKIFFGDPTWGDEYHIRDPRPAPAPELRVWTLDAPDGRALVVWLEATGNAPVSRGPQADFGMDAAMFAFGDLAGGQALVTLGEQLQDEGKGDSYAWLWPQIESDRYYAKWLPIPPDDKPIFVVGTGMDGGLGAVWLLDQTNAVSGLLIDIAGRASDGRFIDLLLPQ